MPPKLVFSMLKDRELSNKLKALRLPTEGRRQVAPLIESLSILVSHQCTHWLIHIAVNLQEQVTYPKDHEVLYSLISHLST